MGYLTPNYQKWDFSKKKLVYKIPNTQSTRIVTRNLIRLKKIVIGRISCKNYTEKNILELIFQMIVGTQYYRVYYYYFNTEL